MFPHLCLYAGDFNCRHADWGYDDNSPDGECLAGWASINCLALLYNAKDAASFYSGRWNTGTNPDLAFAIVGPNSCLPDRRVLEKFPRSQHRPLLITPPRFAMAVPSMPVKQWNFRKAKWTHYIALTNKFAKTLLPPDSLDVDAAYQDFCNTIKKAAKKTIPCGYRNNYIPCWDAECESLYKTFLQSPQIDDSSLAATALLAKLDRKRRDQWSEAVQSIDFSHSSRKAWSTLNNLGRSRHSPRHCPVSADAIASQLVKNGKYEAVDRKSSRLVFQEVSDHWRATTPDAVNISDNFSQREFTAALQHLKPGKAPGPDSICPELILYAGAALKAWLRDFLSSCLCQLKIPKIWRRALVVAIPKPLHQRQATSMWWCSPLPCTGEGRNGLLIPRGSHPRAILPWTTLLIFYPCCPMRGHMWTALLNPIDLPPTPSILSRTSLPRPSFHSKPLHYSSHSPLILISMLLLISGDIHPNPGPIDPCSVCSRRVTWGNRSIQCTGCSLWVHLSCSGIKKAILKFNSAETFAILHALEWCISHSKACNFDSITFFSDSLSVLSTLSTPLPYLTPQSLSNTQSLLNSLSQSKVIHLQWIPGHSSLPGNDLADSLAKVGASLDPSSIPVSLTPLISSQRLSLYTSWRRSVQSGFFHHQIPTVSPEELTLPRSTRCALSRLRCNGHSTLLNSYLHRVGRAETPSCSNCGSEPQDLSHLVLDCPVLDPLRRAIFGHTPSLLDLWSRPWGVA